MRLQSALIYLVSFFGAAAVTPVSLAQVSPSELARLGLEHAWSSQIQMPLAGRGLASADLWVDSDHVKKYAVVELKDRTIRVPASRLDRRGNEIGIEEAKKLAGAEAARVLGKPDGFQVVEVSVPDTKLVLATESGLVQTLDAETGELLWSKPCGLARAPAHPAALSEVGITLIHGQDLYLLDWETGKEIHHKRLRYATSNSVSVSKDAAFVTDFTGRVEAYGLTERIPQWGYVINGRAVGAPVAVTGEQDFAAIATDRGFVYVFTKGEEPIVWLRYQASSPILGSLTAANDSLYVGDAGGTMAKVNCRERIGRVLWEQRTGHTISTPALVTGGEVFFATENGELVALDDETGEYKWSVRVRAFQPIARSNGKVFFRTITDEIGAVDVASGQLIAQSRSLQLGGPIVNQLTDRIYVMTELGGIQCLRPIGAELPNFITPPAPKVEGEGSPTDEIQTAPADIGGSPFEGFGATPAADAGNPFGGGVDPFGGGAGGNSGPEATGTEAPGTDPFGGDPFGGDPFK